MSAKTERGCFAGTCTCRPTCIVQTYQDCITKITAAFTPTAEFILKRQTPFSISVNMVPNISNNKFPWFLS